MSPLYPPLMEGAQASPPLGRVGPFTVLVRGLLLLTVSGLPSHAAARCFGVPTEAEEPTQEGSWSLVFLVTSSNGFQAVATLGVDPEASEGYGTDFDAVEPLFDFFPGLGSWS